MNFNPVHSVSAAVVLPVLGVGLLLSPAAARAQQAQSRLTPLITHPSAEVIGPTQRLSGERVDLSTITREDSSMLVGNELAQGESVARLRQVRDTSPAADTSRQRRERAIREQDDTRHKREAAIEDD